VAEDTRKFTIYATENPTDELGDNVYSFWVTLDNKNYGATISTT